MVVVQGVLKEQTIHFCSFGIAEVAQINTDRQRSKPLRRPTLTRRVIQ